MIAKENEFIDICLLLLKLGAAFYDVSIRKLR